MSQVSPARYVPYGYARQNQLLVSGVSGDAIEVWSNVWGVVFHAGTVLLPQVVDAVGIERVLLQTLGGEEEVGERLGAVAAGGRVSAIDVAMGPEQKPAGVTFIAESDSARGSAGLLSPVGGLSLAAGGTT